MGNCTSRDNCIHLRRPLCVFPLGIPVASKESARRAPFSHTGGGLQLTMCAVQMEVPMEEKSAQEKVTEAYQSAKAKVEKFAADERVQDAKEKVADAAKVAREKAKALASSENIAKARNGFFR